MKTSNITFKLTDAEKEAIRALAARKDVPMSQIIREAVKKYIEEAK
jgi:predicted DNA-binding protein